MSVYEQNQPDNDGPQRIFRVEAISATDAIAELNSEGIKFGEEHPRHKTWVVSEFEVSRQRDEDDWTAIVKYENIGVSE